MQSLSALHKTALAYAEAGIPVFICEEDGKKPRTARGYKDATTDRNQINAWYAENPNYNLAFCPADANLFVVDIDPGADHDYVLRFPHTYSVITPRGGHHLYYEGTGPSTTSRLSDHVDTRSLGGYVLVPPSVVSGGRYRVEQELDYAILPDWVSDALLTNAVPQKTLVEELDLPASISRTITYLRSAEPAVEFKGSDEHTYRVACWVKDLGVSQETAFDLMWEHYIPRCEGEWTDDFVRLKIANAYEHGQNSPACHAVDPSKMFTAATNSVTDPKRSRFYFKDEAEMDDEPDPTWLIKDLISERSTVMMYGASGSYKSFLALDIALSISAGKPTFGSDTKSGLVFYGALEGKAHLKKARRAWRFKHNIDGKIENFFVGRAPMIGVDGEIQEFGEEIMKRCNGKRPTLIIIDTLSKSMAGMNENDAADAGRFIQFCDSLVEEFGCTVMAIHHNGKEENRGARGSSAFLAGFDTVLEVKAVKNTRAVSVYVRKHKDAEEREAAWTFEGRVTAASLTFEATTAEQHRLLSGESSDITARKVGAALKKMNAFGEPAGVTTAVLATELTPAKESETVEDRAANIARTSRAMTAQAKGALEVYCTKHGKSFLWFLTAADE